MTAASVPVRYADPEVDQDCGLRERKKRETRLAIHRAALRLAHESGLESLTVDAISERAGVSARTFFNYYPTKDDALLGGSGADLESLPAFVAARPAGESPRESVRFLALQRVESLARDPELWAMRRELTQREPSLGLRFLGMYARVDRAMVDALIARARSERELSAADELAIAVEAYAALGAFRAATRYHLSAAADADLADVVDLAFGCL